LNLGFPCAGGGGMADIRPDIFSNSAPPEEVARLVAAFIPSRFYLAPYIDYLLAVPLPKNAQGCRIIDPAWQDQVKETLRCIFSNPVLVLKISSANYPDETRYLPNYSFHIGTNGTRGAFTDSARYREIEPISTTTSPNETLKLTPALIIAYCLCNGPSTQHFRLQKLESDKLTKSYSDYVHDDILARHWNPVLASFLFILKLIQSVKVLNGSEAAFLPMIEFTWKEIMTREKTLWPKSQCDQRFFRRIKHIVDELEDKGAHRIFTHAHHLQNAVTEELRNLDSHFTQMLSGYCK
jgi:hypothetical protein